MRKEFRILLNAFLILCAVSPLVASQYSPGPKLVNRLLTAWRAHAAPTPCIEHKEPSYFQEGWTEGKKWAYQFQRLHQTRMIKKESFELFADKLVRQAVQYDNPIATLDAIRKDYFNDIVHYTTWHKWRDESPQSPKYFSLPIQLKGRVLPRLRQQLPYGYADSLYTLFTNEPFIFQPSIPIIDPASLEADTQNWISGTYNEREKRIRLKQAALSAIPLMLKRGHPKLAFHLLLNRYLESHKNQKA